MTQKTKLEIIGPYTPEHDGPFCTRDRRAARVLCSDMKNEWSIVAIVLDDNGIETVSTFLDGGKFSKTGLDRDRDLMNAREVPVAREFWIAVSRNGHRIAFKTKREAELSRGYGLSPIHVREVLPGDDQ